MSRIGKIPVAVPDPVDVSTAGNRLTVKGPKGELTFDLPAGISVEVQAGKAVVKRSSDLRPQRALHGMTRSILNNMVEGVSRGFEKRLNIVGVGYTGRVENGKVILNVGYCQPQVLEIPSGVEVEMPPRTTIMIVRGADKQKVGQFAADIRAVRPPEPYKGKGIRYEKEQVRRKAGKSVVSGTK